VASHVNSTAVHLWLRSDSLPMETHALNPEMTPVCPVSDVGTRRIRAKLAFHVSSMGCRAFAGYEPGGLLSQGLASAQHCRSVVVGPMKTGALDERGSLDGVQNDSS
jgi:hypothetical protein